MSGVARLRWVVVPAYLVAAGVLVVLAGRQLGREIFPPVDAGQFQLRLRGPVGTRIEQTEEVVQEALRFIKEEVGEENVAITLGYVGVVPSSYPINGVYLWMGGPEEAVVRVALKRGPGTPRLEDLKRRLRERLPGHLKDWLERKWLAEGVPSSRVQRARELRLSFEPADIVNEVMSFGSPTPIEVVVSGPSLPQNRAYAEKVRDRLGRIGSMKDLQFVQALDYPTVEVVLDRQKASYCGVTAEDLSRALVAATSSSRFTVPNYWRDPKSGVSYQVQVEVPYVLMNSAQEVELIPVKRNGDKQILVRDVAVVREGTMPGAYDRYNMRRLVSMTANIEGEDLGRVAGHIGRALAAVSGSLTDEEKEAFKGVSVEVRGQVPPMEEMFRGLAFGLALAVAVIFLLLTAYFQSVRLAVTAVAAVPAVLAGIVLVLLATGTTLNLQSFMGSIMAIGVALANAILLVTFADRLRRGGAPAREAAAEGARSRVRPILMTSAAMIAGMLPLALGFGESGDQMGPLGLAVIGGLAASTLATLLVLPAVYVLLQGRSTPRSVSLDPNDPHSPHYVPPTPS